jgi:hypothetical protein
MEDVEILDGMGVVITLEINGRVVSLPDPSGGTFNAAGDFDRLLPLETQLPVSFSVATPMLGRIDPYGEVSFGSADMKAIAGEALALSAHAKEGAEQRGLDRLRVLAERGSHEPGSVLRAVGD